MIGCAQDDMSVCAREDMSVVPPYLKKNQQAQPASPVANH
jgi:hypothetical protein